MVKKTVIKELKSVTLLFIISDFRIGRFPVQTPLGARPGLGTQPHYEAPGDLRIELVENTVINIGLVRLPPREWSIVSRGTAK